jgi:hypothetical protein
VTPAQKARLLGFNASLIQRGVSLALQDSDSSFTALVQPVVPESGEFSLSNDTREAAKIHILRSAPGIGTVMVGSVFSDSVYLYRVTKIDDQPANIAVVFFCEVSQ